MMRAVFAALFVFGAAPQALAQDARVEVRATCVDTGGLPHPAAQTFAAQEPAADFEGELFRCLAGTRLRYDADHAVRDCAAGEALWLGAGALSCRQAAPMAREEERALLRAFGAGVKRVRLAAAPGPEQQRPTRWRY